MDWLDAYTTQAALTDRFQDRDNHLELLAIGLMGEAGSILAEVKKMKREKEAYPTYRHRLVEELGDFLWYFVRLASVSDPALLRALARADHESTPRGDDLKALLAFASGVGEALEYVRQGKNPDVAKALGSVWLRLMAVARATGTELEEAANSNLMKIQSRWPVERVSYPLFDENFPIEEQIPRVGTLEFVQRTRGPRVEVLLRCQAIGVGDRLTDNI